MSIIYNALKKTEQTQLASNEASQENLVAKPKARFHIKYLAALCILLMTSLFGLYLIIPSKKPVVVIKPIVHRISLKLNGVFISQDEKFALINNHEYRVGEIIGDLKIIAIDMNAVTLQRGSKLYVIHTV